MWMDEQKPKVNQERVNEAASLNPDMIASACPFCHIMLDDGINETGNQEKMQNRDVAQIVESAMQLNDT